MSGAIDFSMKSDALKAAKRLVASGKATRAAFKQAMFVDAELLKTNILMDVPRDTGWLAASVFHEQFDDGRDIEEILGATADYALYVEFAKRGTRFKRGKSRFISDNFEKHERGKRSRVAGLTRSFARVLG